MKRLNKIISLFLVVNLMINIILPVFSFSKTNYYVATGDSIAYGYGLSNRDSQSYAQIVKNKLGVSSSSFKNLAVSGMTCEEYYAAIQQTDFSNEIKKADLLTVSIGSNELLELATGALSTATGIPANDPAFLDKVKQAFMSATITKKYEMATIIYNFFTSQETKNKINASIQSYENYWDLSVKYIKQINPNVNIVATEFYNPYYEVQIATFDLGGYVDEAIVKMNKVLNTRSKNETDYKIAKIYKAFNTTKPRLTNVDVNISIYNMQIEMDPHPNVAGHEMIATKIMDAVSTIKESKKKIEELTISDIKDQIYTGKEIKPDVTIKEGSKTLTENTDYTLIYIDNTDVGEAKIKITGIGNYEGNVIKTFNIKAQEKKATDISKLQVTNVAQQTYTGVAIKPTVEIKDGSYTLVEKKDYSLSYQSNTNIGTGKIIIKGIGNYTGENSIAFTIIPKDIAGIVINDIIAQTHTGNEIKPPVIAYDGSIKLVESKDYTVSYSNNKNVGTATIRLTGKNNYTGTIEKNFEIIQNEAETKRNISEVTCSQIEDKIYTGKLITPEVTLTDGNKILIKNTDYILSYENNLNIGKGKLTITGIGDYTGSVEKEFNIIKKDIDNTYIDDIDDQDLSNEPVKPEVEIINDNEELKEGEDYTVEYEDNDKEGTAKIIVRGIDNFDNTMVKTFNIVDKDKKQSENDDDTKKEDEEVDTTVSDKAIPQTGQTVVSIMGLGIISMITIALSIWLKKNKKI